jgi:mono/diheme cytochrome c family protein/WD40 repeat protein
MQFPWISLSALGALFLGICDPLLAAEPPQGAGDVSAVYRDHCASCHGLGRLGGQGPALLPENLGRLGKKATQEVIANGRPATQMPSFADRLDTEQIAALADLVYTPLPSLPEWSTADIEASRIFDARTVAALPDKPVFSADPLNLFVVVESGDHHVSILDGDRFEPIHRFPSRFALHGGPKFSADGRYVFFGSRDGWITKYDLYNLTTVAEVRAGINLRNIALSSDGRYLAAGNFLPHTLVILDAVDLKPLKVIPAADRKGQATSRVSAVYDARPRGSFIVALKDVPELWEVAYRDDAKPIYRGFVHNYEAGMVEGVADPGKFGPRRIDLDEPLDDFFFDPDYRNLLGSGRDAGKAVVVNLNVGRPVATIDMPGLPHLGSGITWNWQGRTVMATPNLKEGVISIIDMKDWGIIKRIETAGPGFFLRSHENTPYAWADVFLGPNKDVMHVIDKSTLEVVATLRPEPGRTLAHAEFTRDGRFVLVSLWEMDGAVIVYDARTFAEVKRLPMVKPSGKYNVFNKISLSAGTSH